jgi:CubicO group peptidase (beta-lactamase class C family)
MGLLVDEGKLDWDEPVVRYLPGLKLHDDYATTHLTPRDMVSHRSGLPRHDLTWYNNETVSRTELVHRLRFLEPNKELRETWQYNNLMFLTAGYLIEQLTGKTWEEAVRTNVLEPLGMERSNFSVFDSQKDDDHALPYLEDDDVLRKVDFRPITVMGPAGSINSSAEEMAAWVKVHLNGGRLNGTPIIAPGTLAELHSPQMVIPGVPKEPENSPASYGMGWFVDTWRGHLRVNHGGNIDGFSALVTLYPRDQLGVVALVNKNGSPLPSLVTSTIADRILGLEPKDWIGEAAEKRDLAKEFVKKGEEKKELFRVEDTSPTRSLAEFAGEYEHPGYGVLKIRAASDRLTLVYNGMVMPMDHWHYDVFNVAESDEEVIPEDLRVNFLSDDRGRLSRLSVPLEPFTDPIVFERLPAKRLKDPEFLARLAGEYEVPNQKITFSVKGNVLVAQILGQPAWELEPSGDDEFNIKGVTGVSIRFAVPEKGPATEALLIQPNGVFTAKRVTGEAGES